MKKNLYIIGVWLLLAYQPSFLFAQDKKERAFIVESALPELYVVDNTLFIKNASIGSKVEIFTIVGNKVLEIELKSSVGEHALNLPKTIYIARMEGVVRKFLIK